MYVRTTCARKPYLVPISVLTVRRCRKAFKAGCGPYRPSDPHISSKVKSSAGPFSEDAVTNGCAILHPRALSHQPHLYNGEAMLNSRNLFNITIGFRFVKSILPSQSWISRPPAFVLACPKWQAIQHWARHDPHNPIIRRRYEDHFGDHRTPTWPLDTGHPRDLNGRTAKPTLVAHAEPDS